MKTGLVPVELGRLLNEAAEARFIADYDEVDVENTVAIERLDAMNRFIEVLEALKDRAA